MLVVPASLGINKTIFQVKEITKHLETNLFVTSKITGCKYGIGKISEGFENNYSRNIKLQHQVKMLKIELLKIKLQ